MAKTPQNKLSRTGASRVAARRILATYKEEFSGPLPHPKILTQYEQACKGAADRIIAMAENQTKHRQDMEAKVVSSNVNNERMGMYFAFSLTIIMMFLGAYLIMNNKSVIGFITLFAPGLFQAGNYIYHKYVEMKHIRDQQKTKE